MSLAIALSEVWVWVAARAVAYSERLLWAGYQARDTAYDKLADEWPHGGS
jgi:hypothetical protein